MIVGGTRSGKSRYALSLGESFDKRAYLATAQALDREMKERIEQHRKDRDPSYTTFEVPIELPEILSSCLPRFDFILVDCLTFWLSNILLSSTSISHVQEKVNALLSAVQSNQTTLVFVSNEVGMGVVPDSDLGRQFRDFQGILNQRIAQLADEVVLMVAGLPLFIKNKERTYENV